MKDEMELTDKMKSMNIDWNAARNLPLKLLLLDQERRRLEADGKLANVIGNEVGIIEMKINSRGVYE